MSTQLQGKTIAFFVAPDGIEQVELTEPWKAVEQAGGTPRLVSVKSGHVQGRDHLEKADTFPVDATLDEVSADDFDGLSLPGGVANPDHLRTQEKAVQFIRGFFEAGKPVTAICHAPWTLVEAGVVRGRTLTSWPSLKTDIRNAGGTWVDEEVQVCTAGPNTLVTSRKPDDLKAYCQEAIEIFAAS
jgi:protease I